jgi:hypothetical protein
MKGFNFDAKNKKFRTKSIIVDEIFWDELMNTTILELFPSLLRG